MVVRKYQSNDFNSWAAMRQKLWPDCSPEETQKEVEQLFQSLNVQVYLAVENDKCAGFMEVSIRPYVNGATSFPVAHIEALFVEPEHRSKGIARKMLDTVISDLSAQGIQEITSDVDFSNTLSQAVHNALGFQEKERVIYYLRAI